MGSSDKCTKKKMAEMKKAGQQAKNLAKKVQELKEQLINTKKSQLEEEKLIAEGKHSAWYSNIAENQARLEAEKEVSKIIKNYQVDISKLTRNVFFLQSLLNYEGQSTELLKLYNEQIKIAKEKIQQLKGKESVDHRLATFYHNKEAIIRPWDRYLRIGYWIVFSLIVVTFLWKLYKAYKAKHMHAAIMPDLPIIVVLAVLPSIILPILFMIRKVFLPT